MPFVDNDHVVKQVSAAGADPTFCYSVLPWTSEARSLGLNAEALYQVDHFAIELWSTIKE